MRTLILFFWLAGADAGVTEQPWTQVTATPFLIQIRRPSGSPVDEVWAEGNLEAHTQDLQAAVLDPERYRFFMPYVKEAREVAKRDADGSFYVYTRVQPPWVNSRDYIVRTWIDERVGKDGQGGFRNHWSATPDLLPQRAHAVRVRLDEGSWEIRDNPDGKTSHVVYRFRVDPGGAIPGFAVDAGNRQAVPDTLRALEREAQRLAVIRQQSTPDAGQR